MFGCTVMVWSPFLFPSQDFGLDEKKFRQEFCAGCPELFYRIAFLCCDLNPDKRCGNSWLTVLDTYLKQRYSFAAIFTILCLRVVGKLVFLAITHFSVVKDVLVL